MGPAAEALGGPGPAVPWAEAEAMGRMVEAEVGPGPEVAEIPCQEGSTWMQYEYKMVQIPPNIEVAAKEHRGQEAALYLEEAVNTRAMAGWEFYRVDVVGVVTTPGCLWALFGAKPSHTEYYVVTFRRPRRATQQ